MVPLEIFTGLGSAIFAGLMNMWSKSMEDRRLQNQMLIARGKLQNEMINDARKMQGKGVSFTRRVIALTVVFSVFVLPKIMAAYGIPVTVGYTEFDPGFWFFTEGREITKWISVGDGFTMTPLDSHGAMAVIGFYFGSRLGR